MRKYYMFNLKRKLQLIFNNIYTRLSKKRINQNNYKNYNREVYKDKFIDYLECNIKIYIKIIIIFIIGIILGCIYINNINYTYKTNIYNYITDDINLVKEYKKSDNLRINKNKLLKISIIKNTIILLMIMILGPTIIGNIFIYIILLFIGFCLGFTISAITMSLGILKSIVYVGSGIFLQNIIFIPILFIASKLSFEMYMYLIKNKHQIGNDIKVKNEIKTYIFKNFICEGCFIISSFVENFISLNLLISLIEIM